MSDKVSYVQMGVCMSKKIFVNEQGRRVGESHPMAVLSDHEVELVHELYADGYGYKRLAKIMEVSHRSIRDILNGKRRCLGFVRVRVIEKS